MEVDNARIPEFAPGRSYHFTDRSPWYPQLRFRTCSIKRASWGRGKSRRFTSQC